MNAIKINRIKRETQDQRYFIYDTKTDYVEISLTTQLFYLKIKAK